MQHSVFIYLLILPTPSRAFLAGTACQGCEKGLKMNEGKDERLREQDSSPTRQFADTVFEDSSPTLLKTVHRHFLSRYLHMA